MTDDLSELDEAIREADKAQERKRAIAFDFQRKTLARTELIGFLSSYRLRLRVRQR